MRRWWLLLAGLMVLLAGCGGGADEAAEADPSEGLKGVVVDVHHDPG